MEQSKNLSAHAVNFFKKLASQCTNQNDSQFFVPLIPSTLINIDSLQDPAKLIEELKIQEVSVPNPIIWQSQNQKSFPEIIQHFLLNPDFEGFDSNDSSIEKDDEVQIEIKIQNRSLQNALKSGNFEEIQKAQNEKYQLMKSNKSELIGNNIVDFNKAIIQDQQNLKLSVIYEQDIKLQEFCLQNQKEQQIKQKYKEISYDSSNEIIQSFDQNDVKLEQILNGFGLGELESNGKLTVPLENSFDKFKISAEWSKITFKRNWFHPHMFENDLFGIQSEEYFSWSNGTMFQQEISAELPYITVGAIIARNIKIEGVKNDSEIKNALDIILKNQNISYALFFKLIRDKQSENYDNTIQEIFNLQQQEIHLKAPRIIGFILKPMYPFPRYSKVQEWFSATYNPNEKNKGETILSQDINILVKFLDKNNGFQYFKNFENLFNECIDIWKKKNIINIKVENDLIKENEDDYLGIIQIKIDKGNQTYTIGYGQVLEQYDQNPEKFNQKFGLPEFIELVTKQNPENYVTQKCKRIILHEIGRIIGLKREQIYDPHILLNKPKIVEFYKKNLIELNKAKNENMDNQQIESEANRLAEEQIFKQINDSNFQNGDKKSIMFIPYPKSWVLKPENYLPQYNDYLSDNDYKLLNKYFDPIPFGTYGNFIDPQENQQIKKQQDTIVQPQLFNTENIQLLQQKAEEEQEKYKKLQKEAEKQRLDELANQIKKENEAEQKRLQYEEEQKRLAKEAEEEQKRLVKEAEFIRLQFEKEQKRLEELEDKKRQEELEVQNRKKEESEAEQKRKEEARQIILTKLVDQKIKNEVVKSKLFAMDKFKKQIVEVKLIKKQIKDYIVSNDLIQPELNLQDIIDIIQGDEEQSKIIQFLGWETIVQTVYEQFKKLDNENPLDFDLPIIQTYEQKQILKDRLIRDQIKDEKIQPVLLQKIYKNLQQETIQQYRSYYKKFNIITNHFEKVMKEEKEECMKDFKQLLKENKQINDENLQELQKKTLIHKTVLLQLYNEIVNVYLEEKELIDILERNIQKLQKKQIAEMLFIEDQNLKDLVIMIFKCDQNDYLKIKKICKDKKISLFLLSNQIEQFILDATEGNIRQAIDYLKKNYSTDPILCLKLLYFLNSLKMEENQKNQIIEEEKKKENENDEVINSLSFQKQKTTVQLQNKKYEIMRIIQSKNIARIIQKALIVSGEDNQEEAFKKQKLYEDRKLFHGEDKDKINEFLKIFENQNQEAITEDTRAIFDDIFKKSGLNVQFNDHEFIQIYIEEQKGYEAIMESEQLNKKGKKEDDQDLFVLNIEDKENNDILKIANFFRRPIVIHEIDDINKYQVFGENFLRNQNVSSLHIVNDNKNEVFCLIRLIDLKIKIDVIDVKMFQREYQQIFDELPFWMKTFFGYKNLFKFILDENDFDYQQKKIDILEDLSKQYRNYEQENIDENFNLTLQYCQNLEKADTSLFNEWYEGILSTKSGQNFSQKFDFLRARQDPHHMVKQLKQIKQAFPDPKNLFNLRDFNRLSSRVDINTLRQLLEDVQNKSSQFIVEIICQMFGFINRRETISTFIAVLRSLNLSVQVSSRFLISLLLQQSDIDLRSRIIHYQSEYFSVPLIMNCQVSYESIKQKLKYVPEIAFSMLEGFGILNIGAGYRSILPIGKSQIMNDLLFPTTELTHEAFEQLDKNLFSFGQVDVFFEKSFDKKRNIVIMDGQGGLQDQAFKSTLILTNIVILHFQKQDFEEDKSLKDLVEKRYIRIKHFEAFIKTGQQLSNQLLLSKSKDYRK